MVYSVTSNDHGDGIISSLYGATEPSLTIQYSTWLVPAYANSGVTSTTAPIALVTNNVAGQCSSASTTNGSNQITTTCTASQSTVTAGTYNSGTGLVTLTITPAISLVSGETFQPALTGTGAGLSAANAVASNPSTFYGSTTLSYYVATGLTMTITGGNITLFPVAGHQVKFSVGGSNAPQPWTITSVSGSTNYTLTMSSNATNTFGPSLLNIYYPATITTTNIIGNAIIANISNSSSSGGANNATSSALIWADYANYINMNINNNLIDGIGSFGAFCFENSSLNNTTGSFSGNKILQTGSSFDHWDTGSHTFGNNCQ